ncbi:MAG TPA: hypothetical protein VFV63_03450, partial [Ilumatobacteraceae bacterium]|nr:hypothetical protein [Ilumatobacteraceae bacterium]
MFRRPALLTAVALGLTSVVVGVMPSPAAAATFTMNVVSPGDGAIGIDAIYTNGGGGGEYDVSTCDSGWDTNGNLVGTQTVPDTRAGGSLTSVRFEMYPGRACGQHATAFWGDVGGVHFETGLRGGNLGTITMPVDGQNGAFALRGDILSSTPITEGRVHVDAFQTERGYPDVFPSLQNNGVVAYGAFGSSASIGARWTAGVGWAGQYVFFVEDRVTGNKVSAIVEITAGTVPTIDLDAICFGLNTCEYSAGGPLTATGTFHATAPTRILDTRFGVGITNGPVRSGGGRESSPDPLTRRDEIANHELKVTGLAGIPESGVSAVLLNITAVDAPADGYLSVTPKPQACCGGMSIYDDQATLISGEPASSNLNVTTSQTVPNLVLARVGAGGKIRLYNWAGPTNVIADLAGWFGTGGANLGGDGFRAVTPSRLLDTRNAIGGPTRPFAAFETRTLKVAGVGGVPTTATSVVVNVTAANVTGSGFATVFPAGTPLPTASNLNYRAGDVRANLAVVRVGSNGSISLYAAESSTDLIVDVMGSFAPTGGGQVTTITPVRLVDSRSALRVHGGLLGTGEVVKIPVRGEAGIPANATAVILNVTAGNTA